MLSVFPQDREHISPPVDQELLHFCTWDLHHICDVSCGISVEQGGHPPLKADCMRPVTCCVCQDGQHEMESRKVAGCAAVASCFCMACLVLAKVYKRTAASVRDNSVQVCAVNFKYSTICY